MSYQISKSEDGFAPFKYANAPEHLQTYFRIVGDLTPFSIPLICIHGGPGLTHHYLLNHSLLSESSNIPIIFYDQIGSGLSTHFPQSTSPSLFTVDLFLSELSQLISHLTARYSFTKYSILGSSWGGMLSSCFAASLQPPNLHKLILANAPASKALSTQNRNLYRKALTQEQQQILDSCEREGKCRTEAYQEVLDVFFKTHICNVEPPQEFLESFRFSKEDRTVINAMDGSADGNPFVSGGTLKDWTMVGKAKRINVPTLVIVGVNELASGEGARPFIDEIPDVELVILEGTTHSPHAEDPERYFEALREFLSS